jgi:hypothetical protein
MNPVRIGLIGVPGSGKTRLARSIKRAMPDHQFAICDGYAEKLRDSLEMTIGIEATYLANIHIASVREQEIRKLSLADKSFIVCGTVFDTLCYAGFHSEMVANTPGNEDEKNSLLQREINSAQLLAYLAIDSFYSFTHMFYLPVTDPDVLIAISTKNPEDSLPGEAEILDKTIQDALRRYGNPATLLQEKHSKNLKTVVETINSGKHGPDNQQDPVS